MSDFSKEKDSGQNEDNEVLKFPKSGMKKPGSKIIFGVFDARDSSLIPLQLLLFVLAAYEAIQGLSFILFPRDAASPHAYAHLGTYMLAYSSALFIIAFRPARARGLLILVTVAALGFVFTAVIDVARGNAELARETQHITKLIAPIVVWLIASRVVTFSSPKSKSATERDI